MKTLSMGLGMIAGAAIALTVVSTVYPDVPKRMTRDGRRLARSAKRAMCDVGDILMK